MKWLPWRAAVAMVPASTLSRWVAHGFVRRDGDRVLYEDLARKIAQRRGFPRRGSR